MSFFEENNFVFSAIGLAFRFSKAYFTNTFRSVVYKIKLAFTIPIRMIYYYTAKIFYNFVKLVS